MALTSSSISIDKKISSTTDSNKSIRAASRKARVYVFRQFLLDTYSELGFSTKTGTTRKNDKHYYNIDNTNPEEKKKFVVLDIAGGKGDLSWLLCNLDDIHSIIIDPRPPNHSSLIKSSIFLRNNPEIAKERNTLPHLPTYQPLAAVLPLLLDRSKNLTQLQTPQHLPLFFNNDLVEAIMINRNRHSSRNEVEYDDDDDDDDGDDVTWLEFYSRVTEIGQRHGQIFNPFFQPNTDNINSETAYETLNLLTNADLLLGFHPDQATDAIVKFAFSLQIPFAIVPCCVFPSEFPERKLQPGAKPVKKYDDLIQYLCQKYPQIRTHTLPFHFTKTARNIVLYTLPKDYK